LEGELLVDTVVKNKLAWEMIPTDQLNNATVLKSLLPNMPVTATIRNLNRFANAKLTEGLSDTTKAIITTKLNKSSIKYSKLHPVNIVNYLKTYASGKGFKGNGTWPVNQKLVDALEDAYHNSVEDFNATGKNILVGLDVSGSMNTEVGGTSFTATQLGAVLALTTLKTEPNAELIAFDTQLQQIALGKRTAITDAMKAVTHGGGTDCSIPIQYALQTKRKFDAIVILTDSETYAGGRHSIDLLNEYRRTINKNVKVIEVAMVANGVTNFPQNDANILRVVGFDASVNEIIAKFIS
jgi:60 kDa SS-A/Ro ribonucleoprotein